MFGNSYTFPRFTFQDDSRFSDIVPLLANREEVSQERPVFLEILDRVKSLEKNVLNICSQKSKEIEDVVARNNSLTRENKELFSKIEELEEDLERHYDLQKIIDECRKIIKAQKSDLRAQKFHEKKLREQISSQKKEILTLQSVIEDQESNRLSMCEDLLIASNETTTSKHDLKKMEQELEIIKKEYDGLLQDYGYYREDTDLEIERLKRAFSFDSWTSLEFEEEVFPNLDLEFFPSEKD